MFRFRIQSTVNLLVSALLLPVAAAAQTTIPATGLCNTGLTPASPLPTGCTASTLVTPVNPGSGGSSVDGNWQLATPYPSGSYIRQAPDPCLLRKFGPAWVDAPWFNWFNPNDGLSQWITPEVDEPSAGRLVHLPDRLPNSTYRLWWRQLRFECQWAGDGRQLGCGDLPRESRC
jgi:hypothetical protein